MEKLGKLATAAMGLFSKSPQIKSSSTKELEVSTLCQKIIQTSDTTRAKTHSHQLTNDWNLLIAKGGISLKLASDIEKAATKLDNLGQKTLLPEVLTFRFNELCTNLAIEGGKTTPSVDVAYLKKASIALKKYAEKLDYKIGDFKSKAIELAAANARQIYANILTDTSSDEPKPAEPEGLVYLQRNNFEKIYIELSKDDPLTLTVIKRAAFINELKNFYNLFKPDKSNLPKSLAIKILLIANRLQDGQTEISDLKRITDYITPRLNLDARPASPIAPRFDREADTLLAQSTALGACLEAPDPPVAADGAPIVENPLSLKIARLSTELLDPNRLLDGNIPTLGVECKEFMAEFFKQTIEAQAAFYRANQKSITPIFNIELRRVIEEAECLMHLARAENGRIFGDDNNAMVTLCCKYIALAENLGTSIPSLTQYLYAIGRVITADKFTEYKPECDRRKQEALTLIDTILRPTITPLIASVTSMIANFLSEVTRAGNNLDSLRELKKEFCTVSKSLSELGQDPDEIDALIKTIRKTETAIIAGSYPTSTKTSRYSQFTLPAHDLTHEYSPGAARHACCFIAAYNIYHQLAGIEPATLEDSIYLGLARQQRACRTHTIHYTDGLPYPGLTESTEAIPIISDLLKPLAEEHPELSTILEENQEVTIYKTLLNNLITLLPEDNKIGAMILKNGVYYTITIQNDADGNQKFIVTDSHGFSPDKNTGAPDDLINKAFQCEFYDLEKTAEFLAIRTPYETPLDKSKNQQINECHFYPFTLANPLAEAAAAGDKIALDTQFMGHQKSLIDIVL